MCCYKDFKNFERFNNLIQLVLHRAISFIESLPRDCQTSSHNVRSLMSAEDMSSVGIKMPMTPPTHDDDVDVDVMSVDAADGEDGGDVNVAKKTPNDDDTISSERAHQSTSIPVPVAELTDDVTPGEPHADTGESTANNDTGDTEEWSLEEKERLFQFIGKVFTPSFPLYFAYKHCIHSSLEDLSKQDACALNNYCELSVSTSYASVFVDSQTVTADYTTLNEM